MARILTPEAQFTNLAPPAWDAQGDTAQGPSFANGQMGCRKIINRQLIEVSSLVSGLAAIGRTNGAPIIITNTSQTTIPGPLALEFRNPSSNLTSKSFVASCASDSNAYMYPDGNNSGGLAPGASLTFTPVFEGASGYAVVLALVRVGKVSGSDPAKVDLTGTPGQSARRWRNHHLWSSQSVVYRNAQQSIVDTQLGLHQFHFFKIRSIRNGGLSLRSQPHRPCIGSNERHRNCAAQGDDRRSCRRSRRMGHSAPAHRR